MELTTRLLQFEWIGSTKLPSSVAYFAGEVRNNPIDWNYGGALVTVWKPSVDSTEITTDTQISGGLWATATGLEFRNGAYVAEYPCTWEVGETLIICLTTTADGKIKLGIMREFEIMYDDCEIMYDNFQIMYEVQ